MGLSRLRSRNCLVSSEKVLGQESCSDVSAVPYADLTHTFSVQLAGTSCFQSLEQPAA